MPGHYNGQSRYPSRGPPSMAAMVAQNQLRKKSNHQPMENALAQKLRENSSSAVHHKSGDDYKVGNHQSFPPQNHRSKANLPPNFFRIGDIVWAPHVTPNLNPDANSGDPAILLSETMGSVCAKERPWIVLGILQSSGLIALPLYTSTGKGPAALPDVKRDECIMVVGRNQSAPFIRGVKNTETLRVKDDWYPGETSHVKLTEIQLIRFEWHMRVASGLDEDSITRCRKWFERFLDASYMPFDKQNDFIDSYMEPEDWPEPAADADRRLDSYRPKHDDKKNKGAPRFNEIKTSRWGNAAAPGSNAPHAGSKKR